MRRFLHLCLLTCLAALVLTSTALADMGPKPQLTVKVENPPEEAYYMDIFAQGNYKDASHPFNGLELSYSEEEISALDQELLQAVRAAVPEGWHACTAEGSTGAPMWGDLYPDKNGLHTFGYHGVPETYRILMVTASGETWISETYARKTLQASVTLAWETKQVTVPPSHMGYLLQFLATFLPTILIEGLLLWCFGYSRRRNWLVFLLVNLITQGGLSLFFGITAVRQGVGFGYYLLFLPAEVLILLVEALLYRRLLTDRGKGRATAYAITANLCSALLGWFLAEPVWRFVVSIS